MKRFLVVVLICLLCAFVTTAQDKKEESKSPNLRQSYSGKFGLYSGSDGLNNGLLIGIDGITEFVHYNFFLSGAAELYPKQTMGIFKNAPPSGYQQAMFLLPLHANFGYKIVDVGDADSRGYLGVGLGYYLYFYNVDYAGTGGIFGGLGGGSESKSGGGMFASVFTRFLIGQIFIEPRVYLAAKSEDAAGPYQFVVNPSGFAVTLGFQYQ